MVGIILVVLLAVAGSVLLFGFHRALAGPRPLSGTRCQHCRKRRAMEEVDRQFLKENTKFNIDHYRVIYRCMHCGDQREQEEQVTC